MRFCSKFGTCSKSSPPMLSAHRSEPLTRGTVNKFVSLLAFGAFMTLSAAASTDKTAQQQFQHAADEYFDQVYFPNQPTAGTVTGYHQYDTKLEDLASASIDA